MEELNTSGADLDVHQLQQQWQLQQPPPDLAKHPLHPSVAHQQQQQPTISQEISNQLSDLQHQLQPLSYSSIETSDPVKLDSSNPDETLTKGLNMIPNTITDTKDSSSLAPDQLSPTVGPDAEPQKSDADNVDAEVDRQIAEIYRKTFGKSDANNKTSNSFPQFPDSVDLKCNICDKKFWDIGKMNSHLRQHAGGKAFVCFFCHQGFNHKGNLRSHLRIHTGEKPFSCQMCDQRFAQRGNLETHLRTHTGERPFMCDICDMSFSRRDSLTSHMRSHTGERPHVCSYCDARFSRKTMLSMHIRGHTGEKPFVCDICNQKFTRKDTLTAHRHTHTREKMHPCEICKREFSFKASLQRHLRTHLGIKKHACVVCDRRFAEKSHVRTHMKQHIGKVPHLCTVCFKVCETNEEVSRLNGSDNQLAYVCGSCAGGKKTMITGVKTEPVVEGEIAEPTV